MAKEVLFRVGTGGIIINSKDQILLGLRGSKARDQHYKWELLGGLLKDGETPEETIKREVLEEAGINIEPIDIIGTNVRYGTDNNEFWVGMTYKCKYISGKPHVTKFDRVIDHKWLSLEECLKMDLTPMTRYQLDQYKSWLSRNS